MVSLTLQGTLKDGFGEAVVVCDMTKLYKFPPLDSCQKRFQWTHKGVDLALHPVTGLVIQGGDAEKFPHALGFESLDAFFPVSKQGRCFTATDEDESDKRLSQPELACKAESVALPDPV